MARIIDLKKLREESSPQNILVNDRPEISTRPMNAGKSKSHQFFEKRTERVRQDSAAYAAEKEPPVKQPDPAPASIEWKTQDGPRTKNARDRIVVIAILAAGFIVGGLLTQNYLFALLALLIAITLIMLSVREPKEIAFAISPRGIRVDNRLYEFDFIKSFWIFYDPPHIKELSVESKKVLMPYIKIPLEDIDPNTIRQILKNYIPERKHHESFSDSIGHWLGI